MKHGIQFSKVKACEALFYPLDATAVANITARAFATMIANSRPLTRH